METHIDLWFAASIVAISLLLSAFFAGAETAFTAASRARMHALEQAGDPRAAIVNRILAIRERFIGAMLIGYNIVAIGASAFTTSVLTALFGKSGVIYATVGMSVLVIVFAEVLPKTLAISKPDKAALLTARPVAFAVALMGPLAIAIEHLVRLMLKPFGVTIGEHQSILTAAEELRGQVALMHREGASQRPSATCWAASSTSRTCRSPTSWSTAPRCGRSTPTSPPRTSSAPSCPRPIRACPCGAARRRTSSACSTPRTFCGRSTRRGDASGLKVEALALETWFVPGTTSLRAQLKAFLTKKTHFALVVDEYGEVMGLVTLEDILEEIVGDIADEHDVTVSGVRPQGDGSVNVDGGVPIRDLNRAMDWKLPDEEATTIAGLVIHEARTIPDQGTAFNFHGFRFQVLRKAKNRITTLRITPLTATGLQATAQPDAQRDAV